MISPCRPGDDQIEQRALLLRGCRGPAPDASQKLRTMKVAVQTVRGSASPCGQPRDAAIVAADGVATRSDVTV